MERCLAENAANGFQGVARKFWLFPIGLSIALDLALVFTAFGLKLESGGPAFALYLVYSCLKWFIGAAAISLLLKVFGQTARLDIVLACYTLFVIYAPIFSLCTSPNLYYEMWLALQLKAQNLDLVDTLSYVVAHAKDLKPSGVQNFMILASSQIVSAIFIIPSVLLSEILTNRLINDKVKTYLAVWLSSFVSLLPTVALNVIWLAVVWRQMTPDIPT
jgi:hypothetical protein